MRFTVLYTLQYKLNSIHKYTVFSTILLCQSKHVVNDKQRYTAYKAYAASETNKSGSLYIALELFYNCIV